MIPMTLSEIAAVVGGSVHDDQGSVVTAPAFIDSRVAEEGGLFVAVEGERVDGHAYVDEALAAGAAAVLARRPVGAPAVVVDDVLTALADLARHVLTRLPEVTVVALTGSQGKTSTKDLLAQVLGKRGATVATLGSFNNELGLPLTVLRADTSTRYLVLEMGARGIGHLRDLCAIAPPQVSVVLNVGKAHLGEFGSQEAIAQAKGELVEALPADGVAVLNADDRLVSAMAARTVARVFTFGESEAADVRALGVRLDDSGRAELDLEVDGEREHVRLQLVGEHHVGNAAAAAAAALSLGMSLDEVAAALSGAGNTSRWRMEVHERADGVTVVNDAYNANPDSMRAALKALAALGRGRGARTIAVLGEMRELGDAATEEHDAVGRLAVRLDINQLVVVGEPARALHLGACLEGSWGGESVFVPDHEAALAWLREHLAPGDVVLVKASRAAALERVAEALLEPVPETGTETDPGTGAEADRETGPNEENRP
ncbi:UDP-N-acetylmuramoyl-tripeptide--D-alanyl-D-alanine ligase [Nocardioides mesophilus]|uniref:UDP-N-acetylmuramoyl-tripeptide--D-alanyl-D-alanine ligase n=1 Tax=Nocardioides mesophilus TaxID=433659 RepID=A0A7G9RBW9_9ACTN|nr:UDP-N-acetylmuramoyl-tripeptide--D-alanyl-D-alanine ligase [Nocardioides mesophilus]QNN53094.1 UDP-N-acetylmuramoyl-tripeptide--D-alanyl-D-alanine ligase [Nocardioides mesophilus]